MSRSTDRTPFFCSPKRKPVAEVHTSRSKRSRDAAPASEPRYGWAGREESIASVSRFLDMSSIDPSQPVPDACEDDIGSQHVSRDTFLCLPPPAGDASLSGLMEEATCDSPPTPPTPPFERYGSMLVSPRLAHSPFVTGAAQAAPFGAPASPLQPALPSSGLPMPDQSAFENGVTWQTPIRTQPRPPPTPRRTPLERKDSLNIDKMLMDLSNDESYLSDSPASDGAFTFHTAFTRPRFIGSGAFSEVYRAISVTDNQVYAVKRSKQPFRSRKERDRQLQEALQAARLGGACPHIVRYFKAWQEGGHLHLQLEFCERGNLKAFVDDLPPDAQVPEHTLWHLVGQLATALDYLHARGKVHLDVKPHNVFLTRDGTLKLGDLGMAIDCDTQEDGWEGDSRYMALELLHGTRKLPASDVFSLGVSVIELATRCEPPAMGDAWHRLRHGKLPPMPGTSAGLQQVVRLMTHPDPASRPTAADLLRLPAVQHALQTGDSFVQTVPLRESVELARSASVLGMECDDFEMDAPVMTLVGGSRRASAAGTGIAVAPQPLPARTAAGLRMSSPTPAPPLLRGDAAEPVFRAALAAGAPLTAPPRARPAGMRRVRLDSSDMVTPRDQPTRRHWD